MNMKNENDKPTIVGFLAVKPSLMLSKFSPGSILDSELESLQTIISTGMMKISYDPENGIRVDFDEEQLKESVEEFRSYMKTAMLPISHDDVSLLHLEKTAFIQPRLLESVGFKHGADNIWRLNEVVSE